MQTVETGKAWLMVEKSIASVTGSVCSEDHHVNGLPSITLIGSSSLVRSQRESAVTLTTEDAAGEGSKKRALDMFTRKMGKPKKKCMLGELKVQGRPKPTNERVKTKMARTIRDGFGRRQRRSVIVCWRAALCCLFGLVVGFLQRTLRGCMHFFQYIDPFFRDRSIVVPTSATDDIEIGVDHCCCFFDFFKF